MRDDNLPTWALYLLIFVGMSCIFLALGYLGQKQEECENQGKALVRSAWGYECVSK